jgi:hypothetical protein
MIMMRWTTIGTLLLIVAVPISDLEPDTGRLITFDNGSPLSVTLPGDPAWWISIKPKPGAAVVVAAPAGTIDGESSVTLRWGQTIRLKPAGANWKSVSAKEWASNNSK